MTAGIVMVVSFLVAGVGDGAGADKSSATMIALDEQTTSHRRRLVRSEASVHTNLQTPSFNFWGHNVRSVSDTEYLSMLQVETAYGDHIHNKMSKSIVLDAPSHQPQILIDLAKPSFSQFEQDKIVEPILQKMGKGFFVESGALDGETDSNTLFFELHKNWTGLLVEPNPRSYPRLKAKKRHAWSFHGCLSPNGREQLLQFDAAPVGAEGIAKISDTGGYTVQAQPLEMLLKKVGHLTVDFWSLDIEGSESAVLNSTNFGNVEVGMLMIEMNKDEKNNAGIMEVMNREAFQRIGHTIDNTGPPTTRGQFVDGIFVNPKYFQKRGLQVPTSQDLPKANRI